MEYVVAVFVGVVIGMVIGFVLSKLKGRENHELVRKLQWQLDSERGNASQNADRLQKLVEMAKAEGREQVEMVKTDFEKRMVELKTETEKQKAEALETLETRHLLDLQEQKNHYAEAKALVERQFRELLAAQEHNHELVLKAQQERFEEVMEKVSAQLKSATEDMLKQRQKEFVESSHANLGQIVTPLRETIEKMKQSMSESTLKQTELGAAMKVGLENMIRQSEAARQSADQLASVFRHKSKVQGNWGERVLEELLESQGLRCGIHYERECVIRDAAGNVVKTDTGGNLRPDVILHLDANREIIIDSKVSLTAFMDYVNAETEDERQTHLRNHIESIQRHVKELSKKDYSSYIQPPKQKMDYVIMFVPHSGALWTALNAQPDLWRRAMETDVFIADEQTLFAALRMVNLTWRQIEQAQNHEKVYALANEMLDRVGKFVKNYEAVGNALQKAQTAYEEGEKKLSDRGQSIILTCNKLEKLGAKQNAKNPIPHIDEEEMLER